MQYGQRRVHAAAQDSIATVAGSLKVGQVARWHTNTRGLSDRSNASSCRLIGLPVTVRLSSSFSIIAGEV